jgi:hypothetical protein
MPANARFSAPLARLHRNNVGVTHKRHSKGKIPPGNWKQIFSRAYQITASEKSIESRVSVKRFALAGAGSSILAISC